MYKRLDKTEIQEENETSVNDILYDWVNSSSITF